MKHSANFFIIYASNSPKVGFRISLEMIHHIITNNHLKDYSSVSQLQNATVKIKLLKQFCHLSKKAEYPFTT